MERLIESLILVLVLRLLTREFQGWNLGLVTYWWTHSEISQSLKFETLCI